MRFRTYKSAGVRVTRSVHASIFAGNKARDLGDRGAASAAYRAALAEDPSLGHIWIQLGHALKDTGDLDGARDAYLHAEASGDPHAAEAQFHLGHVAKQQGRTAEAVQMLIRAARHDPTASAPLVALLDLLPLAQDGVQLAPGELRRMLADLPADLPAASASTRRSDAFAIALNCTPILGAVASGELAAGTVQRQMHLIDAALSTTIGRVLLAFTAPSLKHWVELSEATYREVCDPGKLRSREDGPRSLASWSLASAAQQPLEWLAGDWLVDLAPPKDPSEHMLAVNAVRHHHGVRYAAIVDDLLPLALPHLTKAAPSDTGDWLRGLSGSADLILAASVEIADQIRALTGEANGGAISVIDMAASRLGVVETPPVAEEERKSYVVVVGDVCAAKGHTVALDAWSSLLRTRGPRTPDLLFLGDTTGPDSAAVLQRVVANAALAAKVRVADGAADRELADLYDRACLVLCPTLYEGSSAIVADARARRARIIASDLPALRDANDGALFVPPGDAAALKAAVERLLDEAPADRSSAGTGHGRSWADVAVGLTATLDRMATEALPPVPLQARPGYWHSLTALNVPGIDAVAGSGAFFRSDAGWLAPTKTGCWTRPGGGEVTIGLARDEPWRLAIQLVGLPTRGTRWSLEVDERDPVIGSIEAGDRKWVVLDDIRPPQGRLRLFLVGQTNDVVKMTDDDNGPKSVGSVGIAGFYVCRQEDWAARDKLVETIALGDLRMIDAYA